MTTCITIVAKKRTDFGLLIEAALFMGPILSLEEQPGFENEHARIEAHILRRASAMPEETQEAIKKAVYRNVLYWEFSLETF
jgi:hypothetical protein